MTREQNQLIKKIRNLAPDDVARVLQFLPQLRAPELRAVPELKAVAGGQEERTAQFGAPDIPGVLQEAGWRIGSDADKAIDPKPVSAADKRADAESAALSNAASLLEAEIAHAACAQWRRRPFQAIDADDLQPIAALFREAVDNRAASRFRYGSR